MFGLKCGENNACQYSNEIQFVISYYEITDDIVIVPYDSVCTTL